MANTAQVRKNFGGNGIPGGRQPRALCWRVWLYYLRHALIKNFALFASVSNVNISRFRRSTRSGQLRRTWSFSTKWAKRWHLIISCVCFIFCGGGYDEQISLAWSAPYLRYKTCSGRGRSLPGSKVDAPQIPCHDSMICPHYPDSLRDGVEIRDKICANLAQSN